jgi:hypothetical protein
VSFALGTVYETLAICAILALFHRPRDRNAKWAAIFDATFALRAATLVANGRRVARRRRHDKGNRRGCRR